MMEKKAFECLLTDGWRQKKDFVFVSYASADWEKVYPTVLALRAMGINVYIDVEFLENQSLNWLANFQERLREDPYCQGIVTFLSINYMRSYACLMEQLANRTKRLYSIAMGGFHPVFYIALEPEIGSVQSMKSYLGKCRKESYMQSVEIASEECAVLQDFIADMHADYGTYSTTDADRKVKMLKNKHDVAITMYELIFQKNTPNILGFDGPKDCAELLYRNFVGEKNTTIDLEALEDLKEETLQKFREAKYFFGEASEFGAPEKPSPAPQPVPVPESAPAVQEGENNSRDSVEKKPVEAAIEKPGPSPTAKPAVTEISRPQRRGPGRPPKNAQAGLATQQGRGVAAATAAEKRGLGWPRKDAQISVQPSEKAVDTGKSKIDLSSIISKSSEMKIGRYVRSVMRALSDQDFSFSDADLEGFQTSEYTSRVFHLGGYEFLKPIDHRDQISVLAKDKSGANSRYWAEIFHFNGRDFLICSQWYDKQRPAFQKWLDDTLENYAREKNEAAEGTNQTKPGDQGAPARTASAMGTTGGRGNAEIVNYKIYGKFYASSQKEMLGTVFHEVIERHPDKLPELADQLMCVAIADYSNTPKDQKPVYFASLCVYDLDGIKYSIGGALGMTEKLRQIAKLLDICGVDRSEVEIEGHELPEVSRRKRSSIN